MSFSGPTTLQSAVSATADGKAQPVHGKSTVAFQVTGTFTATVTFQGTIDGTNWVSLQAVPVVGGAVVSTAAAAGIWVASCAGLAQVRATVTWTSGTSVTVTCLAIDDTSAVPSSSEGPAAAGAAHSGNPVLIGVSDGTNVRRALGDALGNQRVAISDASGQFATNMLHPASVDSTSPGGAYGLRVISSMLVQGPTNAERLRNNQEGTALASAARTAATNSADLVNYNGGPIHVQVNTTVIPSDNFTVTIQGKDALSGTYYTILAATAISSTGLVVLKVGRGMVAAANLVANDMVPRTWRISVAVSSATSITYSVGYSQNMVGG